MQADADLGEFVFGVPGPGGPGDQSAVDEMVEPLAQNTFLVGFRSATSAVLPAIMSTIAGALFVVFVIRAGGCWCSPQAS
ncbi:hypothetical protein [Microlunatus endophyticus]|uniref:hypothetical protein n=1 Tax=Microlunatus endophyticus TaxID=1716077 RepID=UPI001E3CC363|nr:hypothetical protein [Microlunatus endophyticus]